MSVRADVDMSVVQCIHFFFNECAYIAFACATCRAYLKLKDELQRQKKKDLNEFGGLFERGAITVSDDTDTCPSKSTPDGYGNGMTIQDALRSIRDMESVAERYYRDGHTEESRQMLHKAAALKRDIEEFAASKDPAQGTSHANGTTASAGGQDSGPLGLDWGKVDFEHPTEEVVASAREAGLDLQDKRWELRGSGGGRVCWDVVMCMSSPVTCLLSRHLSDHCLNMT